MNKIELKGLDAEIYTETLENGLEIYLLPYENKKNYYISFATKYGSDVLSYQDKEEYKYNPPLGVAHFLEHKMFEDEDGEDPFTFFSKSGTDSNASTSYDNTQYICYGNKNFTENLRFLIKLVSKPHFTDENVEKEKGIITEELKMYSDIPDYKIELKLREILYHNSSRKYDIGGTIEDVEKITKEDLYNCYNNFYVPNNMFIIIAGNFNIHDADRIITEELYLKEEKELPIILNNKEPDTTVKKNITIKENIEVPKLAFGLKVPINNLGISGIELDLYLNMLTNILFGSSSEFRERVRNDKLIRGIYTEWESIDDLRVFYFISTTINPDKLLEEIEYEFEHLPISEKAFERIKKVWIANEVKMIDSIDKTVNNLFDDIISYNKIIPNKIDIIKKMQLKELNKIIKKIDFTNTSYVKMVNGNSQEEL